MTRVSPRRLRYPGCLGLCGARSGGLIVAVNALPQLGFDGGGLGVAFIVRSLLAMDDAGEAVRRRDARMHFL